MKIVLDIETPEDSHVDMVTASLWILAPLPKTGEPYNLLLTLESMNLEDITDKDLNGFVARWMEMGRLNGLAVKVEECINAELEILLAERAKGKE